MKFKGSYVGIWRESSYSDALLRNIAAHARAEKGKKVKVIIDENGLKLIKQRIFKENTVEVYGGNDIKKFMRNSLSVNVVMIFLANKNEKYDVVAIRCDSQDDALAMVTALHQHRENDGFKSMDPNNTGYQSLRDRSAHNANRQLNEIFKEKQQSNGDINGNQTESNPTRKQNGILKQTSVTPETSFLHSTSAEGPTKIASSDEEKTDRAYLEHKQLADRLSNGRRPSQIGSIHEGSVYTPGVSKRNSMVVKFEPASFHRPRRFSSLRRVSVEQQRPLFDDHRRYSTSTTVQRSIEDTYAKPVNRRSMVRHGSLNSIMMMPHRYSVQPVADKQGDKF